MPRLIDADALKEQVESHVVSMSVCLSMDEHYGKATMREDCLTDIDNAPTVDAIPVVRCRDCKYSDVIYDTTLDTMPLKCLNIRYGGVMPDWYCEHGKRRDDDAAD